MSTKIELSDLYKKFFKSGYVVVNPEKRRTLILVRHDGTKTSTQYARYLISTNVGRFLNKNETVDHIDGDKQNDDIENLQILSLSENIRKTHKKPDVFITCPVCKENFSRTRTQLRGKLKKAFDNKLCCSRKCGGVLSRIK